MSSQPYPSAVPASVAVAAGTTAADALAAAGVPLTGPSGAVVVRDLATDALKDLAWVPDEDAEVEPVPLDSGAGRSVLRHSTAHVMAQAVQDLFPGTRLGIGPPIENGFYYDFLPDRPFTPEDLDRIDKRMQEIVKAGQRFSRRPVSDDEARAELADEPFKLELIGLKGAAEDTEGASAEVGAGQLTMYDNLDRDGATGLDRPVPRPAPAVHPADPGVQADPLGRGVLAGVGEEPAAAADLRHRLGEPGRAQGAPAAAGRGGEARPPPARRRARPVQLPGGARLRPAGLPPQGRHRPARDGELQPDPAREGRLRLRQHPAHHQGPPVRDLRPPGLVRGRHVPAHAARGRELLPQADELPDARPDLPGPRPVLSRAAAADVRVRHRLPVREVRRRARAHPGARADHGRRAHLLHPGAGRRRADLAARPSCSTCSPTSGWTTSTSSCPPATRRSRSAPRRSGRSRPRPCGRWPRRPGSSSCRTRAAPRSTGRRSPCRPGTRSGGPGRCRPSSSTSCCRSGSSWNTRPRTGRGSGR